MTTRKTAGDHPVSATDGPEVMRYAAFTTDPSGGNPAGVVLDAAGLDEVAMLAIAADVGYSETAFITGPGEGQDRRTFPIRYFSPKAEVDFCGHATVATAVALAGRDGPGAYVFRTPPGPVPVEVKRGDDGITRATLTSVPPHVLDVSAGDLDETLTALGWPRTDLDQALPPRISFAGNRHLVIAVATRQRLADLDYDFQALERLMTRLRLTTVQLVWREDPGTFYVRDPFPVGGVVEDPATGAAAAAFGAYLRELGAVGADADITLHQGDDMGRPGLLGVTLKAGEPGVRVSGAAVPIER